MDSWRVMRQDDNGQIFEVSRDLTEKEADDLVESLTSKGHKQLYWKVKLYSNPKEKPMSMLLISTYSRKILDRSGVEGYFERQEKHLWIFPHKLSTVEKLGESPLDATGVTKIDLFLVTQIDEIEYVIDAMTLDKIFDAQNRRYE
jgi:hypothetical protein